MRRRKWPTRARRATGVSPSGIQEVAEQIVLTALDGVACELGVTREEIVLALASGESARSSHGTTGSRRSGSRSWLERASCGGSTRPSRRMQLDSTVALDLREESPSEHPGRRSCSDLLGQLLGR